MIRINLLPTEKKKTRVELGTERLLRLSGLALLLLLAVMGLLWYRLDAKVDDLSAQKRQLQQRMDALKVQVKEVDRYEKDLKIFKEKIAIVERLRRNQSIPVRILDDISSSLPDGVWLSALKVGSGGEVAVEGYAFTNADIVAFAGQLKASRFLKDVTIVESKEAEVEKIPVFQFKIRCQVSV